MAACGLIQPTMNCPQKLDEKMKQIFHLLEDSSQVGEWGVIGYFAVVETHGCASLREGN
jgi:hypothetical protein